ncbi:hypothetical protein CH375_16845, partial [Leptospira ellisii]
QFQNLMEKTNVLSQNMVILQALESLRAMPETFVQMIDKENDTAMKSLDMTMAYGGFAKMGGMYVRTIKNAAGGTEVQTLPTYQFFGYTPPTSFPLIKDSNGNEWDLSKTDALLDGKKDAPSPSDVTVMVRLARNKMLNDFKKVLNTEKTRNYEAELGLAVGFTDGTDLMDSFDEFVEGTMSGQNLACVGKTPEQCAKAAAGSGFLVGDVPDGDFGFVQFSQFYTILKGKKEMDKRKAQMDAARNRRHAGIARMYSPGTAMLTGTENIVKGMKNLSLKDISQMGSMIGKGILKSATGDFKGAKQDFYDAKEYSEQNKNIKQMVEGVTLSMLGNLDYTLFQMEFLNDTIHMGGRGNTLDQKIAEANFEMERMRDQQGKTNRLYDKNLENVVKQDRLIDNVMTTSLGILSQIPVVGPFAALGLVGWKLTRAMYEGGPGAVALMAGSAAVNAIGSGVGVSLNVGYTYADGYSANAGVAAGGVVTRVSWSEEGGYHYGVGLGNNQLNALYTWGGEGDQKTHGWSAALGPLELRHDAIRGYGASYTMSSVYTGGGMGIGVGTTLSYDQRGGFSNSVGFTFTTNSAMISQMEANAQSRANAMNDVNNGMMLRVLEGLGYAVTRRPDAQGNLAEESPFYNETFGSKGILNSMGNAWNSVSNFVSETYNKMFGEKQESAYEASLRLSKLAEQNKQGPLMTVAWDLDFLKNRATDAGGVGYSTEVLDKVLENVPGGKEKLSAIELEIARRLIEAEGNPVTILKTLSDIGSLMDNPGGMDMIAMAPARIPGMISAITDALKSGKVMDAVEVVKNGIKAIVGGDDAWKLENHWSKLTKPGTLSDKEARAWYLANEATIPELVDKTLPLQSQAKQAFELRNEFRSLSRDLMSDRVKAAELAANEKNLTWVQVVDKYKNMNLQGDQLWRAIIESSQRSRSSVNSGLGF